MFVKRTSSSVSAWAWGGTQWWLRASPWQQGAGAAAGAAGACPPLSLLVRLWKLPSVVQLAALPAVYVYVYAAPLVLQSLAGLPYAPSPSESPAGGSMKGAASEAAPRGAQAGASTRGLAPPAGLSSLTLLAAPHAA